MKVCLKKSGTHCKMLEFKDEPYVPPWLNQIGRWLKIEGEVVGNRANVMKAYQLNESEVWTGNTMEDAINAAMRITGNDRDDVLDENAYELDESRLRSVTVLDGDGNIPIGTGWELLQKMTEPGLLWAIQ